MRSNHTIYAVCIAAALAGCDLRSTPEKRINAAIPISEEVLSAKTALLDRESLDRRHEIEDELDARLRARAILCAKGYSPSPFASKEEIRNKLPNRTCFAESDAETAAWLKRRRVALLLREPPLKPMPAKAPAFVIADEPITNAHFADEAGVVLLEMRGSLQVVELETSKAILRETVNSGHSTISPNGRLFTTVSNDRLRIHEVETGTVLAEIPIRMYMLGFHWLDSRHAIYSNLNKVMLLDFESGQESTIGGVRGPIAHAARVADAANQYFLVSGRSIAKIEVNSRKGEPPQATLLQETTMARNPPALTASTFSADSARYCQTGPNLTITMLDTFEQTEISLSPLTAQSCVATGDPDNVIIYGYVKDAPASERGPVNLVYSISAKTVSPLDRKRLGNGRLIYIRPLKKVGLIADSKITVIDELPVQESIPLSEFISEAIEAANRLKFEAAEREAALVRAAPLADLAKDARIDGIGIYERDSASYDRGVPRKAGQVEVRISRTAQPLVLVLSSYESVRWKLVHEPGSRLTAILVSGYYPSEVVGARNVRTVVIGNQHDGRDFNTLDAAVYRYTGKRITLFQTGDRSGMFKVGGPIPVLPPEPRRIIPRSSSPAPASPARQHSPGRQS